MDHLRTFELQLWTLALIQVATNGGNSEDKPFLLCGSSAGDMRKINLQTSVDEMESPKPNSSTAVDFVFGSRTIVWTDLSENAMFSLRLRNQSTLVNNTGQGLAVDWIHGTVYWTRQDGAAIGVAKMDGSCQKTLFDAFEILSVALDPVEGWLFWTDTGVVPKVERAGMDGTHRSVIVSTDTQYPNAISVDLEPRRIYWSDAHKHEICSANYDGSDRATVLRSTSWIKFPFALDIYQNDLYWVEWTIGVECVNKADKATGRNATRIAGALNWGNLTGIRIYHSSKQPAGPNRCGITNGGCSHLCLPAPLLDGDSSNHTTCACPDSYLLQLDGRNCVVVDKCRENNCSHLCLPTLSSYICACPDGMIFSPIDGATCSPEGRGTRSSNESSSSQHGNADSPVGIIVGIPSALVLIVLVVTILYCRHSSRRRVGNATFNEPLDGHMHKMTTTAPRRKSRGKIDLGGFFWTVAHFNTGLQDTRN